VVSNLGALIGLLRINPEEILIIELGAGYWLVFAGMLMLFLYEILAYVRMDLVYLKGIQKIQKTIGDENGM